MFEDKSTRQLAQEVERMKQEIESRIAGPQKPIYVVACDDTNYCYKDAKKAKEKAFEDIFEGSGYDRISCYIRSVAESDYQQLSDSWFEV